MELHPENSRNLNFKKVENTQLGLTCIIWVLMSIHRWLVFIVFSCLSILAHSYSNGEFTQYSIDLRMKGGSSENHAQQGQSSLTGDLSISNKGGSTSAYGSAVASHYFNCGGRVSNDNNEIRLTINGQVMTVGELSCGALPVILVDGASF